MSGNGRRTEGSILMAGKRVHQIAKELGITSKQLLETLQSMGEDIQNPLSSVSEELEERVKKELKGERAKGATKVPRKVAGKEGVPAEKAAKKPSARKEGAAPARVRRSATAKPSPAPEKAAREKKAEGAPSAQAHKEAPPAAAQERKAAPPHTPATERRAAPTHPQAPERTRHHPPKEKPAHAQVRARRTLPREETRAHLEARKAEPVTKPMRKVLRVPAGITVRDFAQRVGRTPAEITRILRSMGESVDIDQPLHEDALLLVAAELGIELEVKSKAPEEVATAEDPPESLRPRPPVVTVMGHVDHGKTSLLDAIRRTAVADREEGGITQHIGASVVEYDGKSITFIDTPGHESFTALRARGAKITDIAVLVVAADDGVMPQTIEAIDHARAAGVPIMVAVNKIDKPEANPTRVRQQLTEFNLLPEEWGGDTVFVDISAKQQTNLDHLLEMILLLSEIYDFRANPDAPASGNIIEARLDRGRGPVATLLVKRGTLKRGDALVAGKVYGRVRALIDDKGRNVVSAGPSMPVEVLGLDSVPEAGDEFVVVEDERKAKAIVEARLTRERAKAAERPARTLTLEDLFRQIQEGEVQECNLIIKADTQGSVEAVRDSVGKMKVGEIVVNIIHSGVGAINENDVMLAKASDAIILGFNVRPDAKTQEMANREKVEIRTYRVIYQLLEELEAALKGMLRPEFEEVRAGLLEVVAVFRVPRQGVVAGALVKEGEINRNSRVRLLRDGAIVFEGAVASLRRFKEDVRSVSAGYECGVALENFQDIKEGDLIEVVELREKPRGEEVSGS